MESAASGILAGINAVRFAENKDFLDLPQNNNAWCTFGIYK